MGFEVGDSVRDDVLVRIGTVVEIKSDTLYPVVVEYPMIGKRSYTMEGYYHTLDGRARIERLDW